MQLTPRYDGPPLLHVDASIGDPMVPTMRQRRRMVDELGTLSAEQWAMPSRCEGWTVQDVVSHLVSVNQFWAMSITAGRGGTPTRFLATFDPVASPPQLVDRMRALPSEDVLGQFVASVDAMATALEGLDETGLATLAESPPGHVPISAVLLHALWDSWIHERDILLPLGRTQAHEDDEVVACLAYAAAVGPAFGAATGSTRTGTLVVDATEPDVTVEIDATTSVTIRVGAAAPDGGPRLTGKAVDLTDALTFRAPFPADAKDHLPPDHHWLLAGLDAVFDLA
jgi:uncharacterized protein (TIGR03083 family)